MGNNIIIRLIFLPLFWISALFSASVSSSGNWNVFWRSKVSRYTLIALLLKKAPFSSFCGDFWGKRKEVSRYKDSWGTTLFHNFSWTWTQKKPFLPGAFGVMKEKGCEIQNQRNTQVGQKVRNKRKKKNSKEKILRSKNSPRSSFSQKFLLHFPRKTKPVNIFRLSKKRATDCGFPHRRRKEKKRKSRKWP